MFRFDKKRNHSACCVLCALYPPLKKKKQSNRNTIKHKPNNMDTLAITREHGDLSEPPSKLADTEDENMDSGSMSRDEHADGSVDDPELVEWASPVLVEAVKIAVCHLLDHILNLYGTNECNGCKINHPSQREHECLRVLEDYFYVDHYHRIRKKLITPGFIPSIKRFLLARKIEASDVKIGIVADTLLYELQSERKILDAIASTYDKLVGNDDVIHGQLEIVTMSYKSNCLCTLCNF